MVLDGFHIQRPKQEKAYEPSLHYRHDKGYFRRGCPDLLMKITVAMVSKNVNLNFVANYTN